MIVHEPLTSLFIDSGLGRINGMKLHLTKTTSKNKKQYIQRSDHLSQGDIFSLLQVSI